MANKVSINVWEKLLPRLNEEKTVTVYSKNTEDAIDVSIKCFVDIKEKMEFVKIVTDACFDIVDGGYIPHAREVAFNVQLIQKFTNLNSGKSVDKLYALSKYSTIIESITEVVGSDLISELEKDIDESLAWEKQRRSKSGKAEELYDALTGLINGFSAMADAAKENVSQDDIKEMLQVLRTSNNTGDLVKAIQTNNKDE